jgi:CheY-like chemotaxis protein
MPEMDGPAFLQVLEGAPVLQRIPVLIVSAYLEDEAPPTSLGLNIVGRLSKPLPQADLLAAVQAALAPTARPA